MSKLDPAKPLKDATKGRWTIGFSDGSGVIRNAGTMYRVARLYVPRRRFL